MRISHILRISLDENEICINVWALDFDRESSISCSVELQQQFFFIFRVAVKWANQQHNSYRLQQKKTAREENLISYSTFGTTVRRACLNILVFVQAERQCAVMHGSKEWGDSEKNFYHSTLVSKTRMHWRPAMELPIEICCIKQLRIFLRNSVMMEMEWGDVNTSSTVIYVIILLLLISTIISGKSAQFPAINQITTMSMVCSVIEQKRNISTEGTT